MTNENKPIAPPKGVPRETTNEVFTKGKTDEYAEAPPTEKAEELDVKKTVEAQGTTSEIPEKNATENLIHKTESKEKKEEMKYKDRKAIELEAKDQAKRKIDSQRALDMRKRKGELTREDIVSAWDPKTKLGQEVKDGKIKNIDEIIDAERKILEPEIVDLLIRAKSDLIAIGQSKGKFGGGKRRAWRQTQRKTKEGNVPTFSTMAVIGDGNGHIGLGTGRAKETLPARDKAVRKAKLNILKIKRSCASFDCDCSDSHTVPFEVTGKSGSVKVTLIPAPQGTGLVVGNELKKILKLAGIKDVYSKTDGRVRTTFNFAKACIDALKKTNPERYEK